MDVNPYEPPQSPPGDPSAASPEEKSRPLNLRRGARRQVGSFRQWIGQFGLLLLLMIVGGGIGAAVGFLVEGAMLGIGLFVVLMVLSGTKPR